MKKDNEDGIGGIKLEFRKRGNEGENDLGNIGEDIESEKDKRGGKWIKIEKDDRKEIEDKEKMEEKRCEKENKEIEKWEGG